MAQYKNSTGCEAHACHFLLTSLPWIVHNQAKEAQGSNPLVKSYNGPFMMICAIGIEKLLEEQRVLLTTPSREPSLSNGPPVYGRICLLPQEEQEKRKKESP